MPGPYLATIRALGSSPAYSAEQLAGASLEARSAADRVSLELAPPFVVVAAPGHTCRPLTIETSVTLADGPGVVVVPVDAPVEVRLRRLADQFGEDVTATVQPGQPMRLSRPIDDGPATWFADVRSAAPFTLCDAATG